MTKYSERSICQLMLVILWLAGWAMQAPSTSFFEIAGSRGIYAIAGSILLTDENIIHVYGWKKFSLTFDMKGAYENGEFILPPPENVTSSRQFESSLIGRFYRAEVVFRLSEWVMIQPGLTYAVVTLVPEFEGGIGDFKYPTIDEEPSDNYESEFNTTGNATSTPSNVADAYGTLRHTFRVAIAQRYVILVMDRDSYQFGDTARVWVDILRPSKWGSIGSTVRFNEGDDGEQLEAGPEEFGASASMEVKDDEIFLQVVDESKRLVYEWTKREVRKSDYQVTFSIPTIGIPGMWSVRTIYPEEWVGFHVRETENADPDVSLKHNINNKDRFQINTCIRGTDSLPVAGRIKVARCYCYLHSIQKTVGDKFPRLPSHVSNVIMQTSACPMVQVGYSPLPCDFDYAYLDANGCAIANLTSLAMTSDAEQQPLETELYSLFCVRFYDPPTGIYQSVCNIDSHIVTVSPIQVEFEITPRYYKPGLPAIFKLQLLVDTIAGEEFYTSIYNHPQDCPLVEWFIGLKPRYFHQFTKVDSKGQITFSLPLMEHLGSLNTQGMATSGDDEGLRFTRNVPHTYLTISDEVIQVWSTEEPIPLPACGHNTTLAKVTVVGNAPLASQHFHVYYNFGGRLIQMDVDNVPDAVEKCEDQDGALGHYTCLSNDEIECIWGWKGDNCLTAVCKEGCNPLGGTCLEPGYCNCASGFLGDNCEYCILCSACTTGNECSCPWYDHECTPLQSVIHTIDAVFKKREPDSTQTFERVISKRSTFTRELTIHLPSHLIGEFSVILGYFRRLPSTDRLNFIFARATFHRDSACPEPEIGPGVFFTASKGVIGSELGLVVVPPQANIDRVNGSTLCHVRVWDASERNTWLADHFVNSQLSQKFFNMYVNEVQVNYHTDLDLRQANLSTILNRKDMITLEVPDSCLYSDTDMHQLPNLAVATLNDLSPDSFFMATSKLVPIGAYYGINHTINVVPIGTAWKASAFCYGPNFGVWSATTEKPFELDPGYIFNITGVRQVKVFEKVYLTANFWYDQTKMPYLNDCYAVNIKFMFNEDEVNILGPSTFGECVCGIQTESQYQLTVLLQPKVPSMTAIITADVSLVAQDCQFNVTMEEQLPDNSSVIKGLVDQAEPQKPLLYRITMHALQVIETERIARKHVSLVVQQPQPGKVNTQISLISLPMTSAVGKEMNRTLWVEIMFNCIPITAVFNRVDKLFSEIPAWNIRHHLAVLSASNTVLNFSTLDIAGSALEMQSTVSRAIRQVDRSAKWIDRYTCPLNNSHGIIITPYIGNCETQGDPWLLLDFFEVIIDMVTIRYPWHTVTMNNYQPFVRAFQHYENLVNSTNGTCMSPVNSTELKAFTEADYVYTAKLYLTFAEKNFKEGYEKLEYLQSSMIPIATACLFNQFKVTSIATYSTVSLAYIARALLRINPEHESTQVVLQQIEQRRHTAKDYDTFMDQSFWFANGSTIEGDIQATANTFLVYLAKPETPEVNSILLNVARWLYQQQNWDGDFNTPEATIPALRALSGYSVRQSNWINKLIPYLPFKVTVRSPGFPDMTSSVELVGAQRAIGSVKMIKLQPHRPLTELEIEMETEQRTEMLALKVTTFQKVVVEPPQTGNFDIAFYPDAQITCPAASISLCFTNKKATSTTGVLSLTAISQSGWEWSPEMYAEAIDLQQEDVRNPIVNYLSIDLSGYLHMVINLTGYMTCTKLEFHWTGMMESPKPMTIQVVEQSPGELVNTGTFEMPSCRSQLIPVSGLQETVFIQRMPNQVLVCPDRISPFDEGRDVFVSELTELCADQPALILHLHHERNGEIPIDVYRIKAFGLFDMWSTRLHPSARHCPGLEDDQVMLVLPRAMVDMQPIDEYLNLNALNLAKLPISLLELGNIEQHEALRILYEASKACDLFNTVLKVAYSLLPEYTQ